MARKYTTVWDGVEFKILKTEEALKLIKADMAQDCSTKTLSATELKFRRDFTGYKTREIRAEAPEPEVPDVTKEVESEKAESEKPEQVKPKTVSIEDWLVYKKPASKKLDKPFNKTTKADVIGYMEQHLGLEVT